jgi:hypothetical protein
MLSGLTGPRKTSVVLLFLGLFACYLALSPGSIAGQGYTGEELQSGDRMLSILDAWVKGAPKPPMQGSRHGSLPALFDLPFIALGKSFGSPDFVLSFQPVLLTAALLTVAFLWMRKLSSPGMSLLLTLTGAFCTMLWPYAYIGLETKQSFFLIFAGYLGLTCGTLRGWGRVVLFSVICGLAIAVKSNGFIFGPVIAYLIYVQFRDDWRSRRAQAVTAVLLVGAIWVLGALGRRFSLGPGLDGFSNLRPFLIDSPFQSFANIIGIFGSPSKGLFVYAPVLLLSLYAVPRALATHRETAIFALLLTGCILALVAVWRFLADEVWGPRYMHTAIVPLLLCIAAARPRFRWRREAPLLALAAIGFAVSFLGAIYYYGLLDFAASRAGQNTMEWITGDRDWNPVQFDARLFRAWRHGGTAPVLWTPKHLWVWSPPPDAQQWKPIDLREFCQPQSVLMSLWHVRKTGLNLVKFNLYLGSLLTGPFLLAWAILTILREQESAIPVEFARRSVSVG